MEFDSQKKFSCLGDMRQMPFPMTESIGFFISWTRQTQPPFGDFSDFWDSECSAVWGYHDVEGEHVLRNIENTFILLD
jgi:hypothetical protein